MPCSLFSVRSTILLLIAVVWLTFVPRISFAADVLISPASGTYSAGQTFTTTIRVAPGGKSVNAVESTLRFDPAVLSVVNISRDGSVFSLWTVEPTFSNSNGTVTFGGGTPTPFTTTANILNVTFRAVASGEASLSFGDSSVLAADGRGTDVFASAVGADYTVSAVATPPPTPLPSTPIQTTPVQQPNDQNSGDEAIIFGDPPRQPEAGSPVFVDADTWYNTKNGVFLWTLPFDVTAVAIEISDSPDNVPQDNPDAIFEPPVDEFAITTELLADGVQYFSINYENQVGWGAVLNRKLQIDTTPPEPFTINVRTGTTPSSFPLLTFEATDETSGIEFYELTIADREPLRITPGEAELGYLLGDLEDGTYTAKVIAYDKAGNVRESTAPVLITAGWIKPIETEETRSIWDWFTWTNVTIFVLLMLVILQGIYFWYEHKLMHKREERLRRETREIQDQMEKIFSALRDEIYDQINSITKRKRLSKGEKEAVESLTQALEVSETLIEKEISDVQSILK